MSNKTTFLLGFLFFFNLQFIHSQDNESDAKMRPIAFENFSAPDSLGIKHAIKQPNNTKNRAVTSIPELPYPIIFIHGLNSSSSTWDGFTNFLDNNHQLNYGGRFDFCLNYDENNLTTNKDFWPTTLADIARFTSNIINGDYYYLNFNVGANGQAFVSSGLSNQSVDSRF